MIIKCYDTYNNDNKNEHNMRIKKRIYKMREKITK